MDAMVLLHGQHPWAIAVIAAVALLCLGAAGWALSVLSAAVEVDADG